MRAMSAGFSVAGYHDALDYLFAGKLEPADVGAVERVEALRRKFVQSTETFPLFNVFQKSARRTAREIAGAASVVMRCPAPGRG